MHSCPQSFEFLWDCATCATFMASFIGHGVARAAGVIRVPWIDFAPFYRHMKRLHGGERRTGGGGGGQPHDVTGRNQGPHAITLLSLTFGEHQGSGSRQGGH